MKITIRDIAKMAGVSHSTVSRSLNDNPMIPETTRNKIKEIARTVDFELNSNGRRLSMDKTGTIGVILSEGYCNIGAEPFFNNLLRKIKLNLEEAAFDVIIEFYRVPGKNESKIKKLINSRKIDGLLIADSRVTKDEWVYAAKKEIPAVVLHFKPDFFDEPEAAYVCSDHVLGGHMAVSHLIGLGHRNIATFTYGEGKSEYREFTERTEGYLRALEEYNIPIDKNRIINTEITFEEACRSTLKNIDIIKKCSAVFAQTDMVAFGVIEALKSLGIRIPEDISVIGYDDIPYSKYHFPKLTTIHQPVEKIVDEGCRYLLGKFDKNSEKVVFKRIIEPDIVYRNTTARVPNFFRQYAPGCIK